MPLKKVGVPNALTDLHLNLSFLSFGASDHHRKRPLSLSLNDGSSVSCSRLRRGEESPDGDMDGEAKQQKREPGLPCQIGRGQGRKEGMRAPLRVASINSETFKKKECIQSNPLNSSPDNGSIRLLVQGRVT